MKRFIRFSFVAIFVTTLVSGCVHPQMTKPSAIQVANHAAEVAGYSLGFYESPKAHFHSITGIWSVYYDSLYPVQSFHGPLIPSLFMLPNLKIVVDDKTEATKIVK